MEWIVYPHAPEGMHFKLADSYGGMGFKHHNGIQSPIDFKQNPSYELNAIIHKIVHAIIDDYDKEGAHAEELKLLLSGKELSLTRTGGHIYPRYTCVLEEEELFQITDINELEITRIDLLMLALSEQ